MSRGSVSTAVRMPSGQKNRLRSSTCPSVSSPAIPSASQWIVLYAEEVAQVLFNFGAGETRIAVGIQKAGLSRQKEPPPVDFD